MTRWREWLFIGHDVHSMRWRGGERQPSSASNARVGLSAKHGRRKCHRRGLFQQIAQSADCRSRDLPRREPPAELSSRRSKAQEDGLTLRPTDHRRDRRPT